MKNHRNEYNGKIESILRVYLRPVMGRKNLHVITQAHASKVLFDGTSLFTYILFNLEVFASLAVAFFQSLDALQCRI